MASSKGKYGLVKLFSLLIYTLYTHSTGLQCKICLILQIQSKSLKATALIQPLPSLTEMGTEAQSGEGLDQGCPACWWHSWN